MIYPLLLLLQTQNYFLHFREGAIDRLVNIYKRCLPVMGVRLTATYFRNLFYYCNLFNSILVYVSSDKIDKDDIRNDKNYSYSS